MARVSRAAERDVAVEPEFGPWLAKASILVVDHMEAKATPAPAKA